MAKEIVYMYCWAFEVRLEKIDNGTITIEGDDITQKNYDLSIC